VPEARSAILRFFHLGGVTVERVDTLPAAQERPLAAGLGDPVTAEEAALVLGRPFALPPTSGRPQLYERYQVVSAVLALPEPVLLSELRADTYLLKKLASQSTGVESVAVGGDPGLWISGAEHVLIAPKAGPRLAGNVLVWQSGGIVYRLEGRRLTQAEALRLAREIQGT
jgi:hypothetical protein